MQWGGRMLDGSLIINKDTLRMSIRKGDTGSVCFRLSEAMYDCTFWFVVKEKASQPDNEAPIFQKYEHVGGSLLLISISEEESDKLVSASSSCGCTQYKDYIWALKYAKHLKDEEGNLIGIGSVKTLIPHPMRRPPIFRVYPEIIEGPHV